MFRAAAPCPLERRVVAVLYLPVNSVDFGHVFCGHAVFFKVDPGGREVHTRRVRVQHEPVQVPEVCALVFVVDLGKDTVEPSAVQYAGQHDHGRNVDRCRLCCCACWGGHAAAPVRAGAHSNCRDARDRCARPQLSVGLKVVRLF